MIKSIVTGVVTIGVLMSGSAVQASVKALSIKPASLTNKSTVVRGSATRAAMVKLTRYHKIYAYGQVTKKGTFTFKLKHKLRAGWTYRFTVKKKGYKTVVKHVKVSVAKSAIQSKPNEVQPGKDNATNNGDQQVNGAQGSSSNNQSVPSTDKPSKPENNGLLNTDDSSSHGNVDSSNSGDNSSNVTDNSPSPADSAQKQRDLANAEVYLKEAERIRQEKEEWNLQFLKYDDRWSLSDASLTTEQEYQKMEKDIVTKRHELDKVSEIVQDKDSIEYQTAKYEVEQAEKKKNDAKERDVQIQTAREMSALYNAEELVQFENSILKDVEELGNKEQYFRKLAHDLYIKYNLDAEGELSQFYE